MYMSYNKPFGCQAVVTLGANKVIFSSLVPVVGSFPFLLPPNLLSVHLLHILYFRQTELAFTETGWGNLVSPNKGSPHRWSTCVQADPCVGAQLVTPRPNLKCPVDRPDSISRIVFLWYWARDRCVCSQIGTLQMADQKNSCNKKPSFLLLPCL